MQDVIQCPHCGKPVPFTEAIKHQIDTKYQAQITTLKKQSEEERAKLIELSKKRIEEEREKAVKESETLLRKKIADEMALQIKNTQNEASELRAQNKTQQEQLLEMSKLMRQMKQDQELMKIEQEKKLNEEFDKLREDATKKADDAYRLKMAEKDKKIQDALALVDEYKRKMEQGSQQTQGEVLELAIEEMLKKEFPFDEIVPVPKGINGADIIQIVRNRNGQVCGKIIWETKRTKSWSGGWIEKLKEDQRSVGADIALLVSEVVPQGVEHFGYAEGVWVSQYTYIKGLVYALRIQLQELFAGKTALNGKSGKMEHLYNYVSSIEFRHRVEAIIEAFTGMQEEIEKERRWFALKWAREEKNLRKVFDSTMGMQGDLQSILGKTLLPKSEVGELSDGEIVSKVSPSDGLFDEISE